jgi:hypothetical protein
LGVQKIQNMRSPTKCGVPKAGVIYRESTGPTARIVAESTTRCCRAARILETDGLNGLRKSGVIHRVIDSTYYSAPRSLGIRRACCDSRV